MLRLDALAWKANMLGISYGKLSETLTQEQAAEFVNEYVEHCQRQQIHVQQTQKNHSA